MSALPKGWAGASIGELCTLVNGRAFKPEEWRTTGLPIVRIQNLNNSSASFNYFAGQFSEKHHLRGGELLFAWSGTPGTSFGAHIWRDQPGVLNQHIFRVDFDPRALDKRFFMHAINQKLDELIGVAQGGVGLRHVTKGVFESTRISVAPYDEQKRVADKLDALLAQVDACRDLLDRVPAIIKSFRQSVLEAATTGALTEEWRTEQKEPWRSVTLADVATEFSYGSAAKSSPTGSVPVLRMGNIQNGCLDWNDLVFTSDQAEIDKYTLQDGDVLFNRTNSPELVGKTAVYRRGRQAIYAGYLIRVRCSKDLLPDFLNYCLGSPYGRNYCWQVKSDGVSQSNINAKKLAAFPFELPGVQEQTEIVRRVEALFALADTLKARLATARARVDRLAPAVLAKAFRGELVPQDPDDEPASALLARIAAKHASPATEARQLTRARTPHAPKEAATMTKSRQDDDVMGQPYLARHLRSLGSPVTAQALFKVAELPVADFYKQLAWEVARGHVKDNQTSLEPGNAAG